MNAKRISASTLEALLIALGVACADSPTAAPAAVATTLDATSATNIGGVVGSLVTELPSVIVRDQNGAPMSGVRVLFTLVAGGGWLTQGSVETDASGQATVSEWVLSRTAEEMVVAATTGLLRVDFHAMAVPGPPATLAKYAGDNQIAPAGSVVPIRPQVRVSDAYNNPIAGLSVMFAVAGGGGSLTEESVRTDSSGIATVGSWTLGSTAAQSLTAAIASLESITFEAKAVHPPKPCGPAVELLLQGKVAKFDVTGQECFERYAIVLSKAGVYEFKLSSTAFDGRLELRDQAGNEIAVGNARVSASSTAIRAVLPAGEFTLAVSSVKPGGEGAFDVSYAPTVMNTDCDEAFIVRGAELERSESWGGHYCKPVALLSTDRFRIHMTAGSSIHAVLQDYSLSDNRFAVQNERGETVATAVSKDYVESSLNFTARADGYYLLIVWVAERYSLILR